MERKILVSLLVIGVVGALATGGTFALFNDTETSNNNAFTAGALDLKVDWNESYNGEVIEEQNFTDNPGPIFQLNDVKPGDQGEATVSLHLFNNPGFVNMTVAQTSNQENGCTEPEAEVDDTCGNPGEGEGELGEHLNFVIWNDDGDNELEDGEEVFFNGTAEELQQQDVALDGDTSTEEIDPFQNSTTQYVGVRWNIPIETGNEIQTDSKMFNITFYAEQARHNGGNITPTPPPAGENETNVSATVEFNNQTSDGQSVNVDSVFIPEDGYVTIHNRSLLDGAVQNSVIGVSGYREAGEYEDVEIELFDVPGANFSRDALNESQLLIAMPHQETSGNETYNFLTSNGTEDIPYFVENTESLGPVTDEAFITIEEEEPPVDNETNVSETVTVNVMKHICDEDVQNVTQFNRVDGPDDGNTTEFHDKVLACPTVVREDDEYVNGTVNFGNKTDFDFEVTGADGEQQTIEDARFEQGELTEAAVNIDVNGDGDLNDSLDTSLYVYENVSSGEVTVNETMPPNNTRPGALEFTPDAIMENNDNQTLLEEKDEVFEDDSVIELNTSVDSDGEITLHVYNFQNLNETNISDGNQTDNDTDDNMTDGNQTNGEPANETLAAISNVEFCVNGTQGPGQTNCPEGEEQLVKFEYILGFIPEGLDPMNVSINATEFKENDTAEPIRAEWSSVTEIATVVVQSSTDVCNFTGGFSGTVESCGPAGPPNNQGPP